MQKILWGFAIGLVFGTGIAVSGMINPDKILNFFDLAGNWDPSLAFVMGGALVVTALGYRVALRRPAPLLDSNFHLPTRRDIDLPLLGGAAIFGAGWGITGFCPGGSIPALGLAQPKALLFVLAMAFGIILSRSIRNRGAR